MFLKKRSLLAYQQKFYDMKNSEKTILFVLRDPLPPKRSDVLRLFGQDLSKRNIGSILVGQFQQDAEKNFNWNGGAWLGLGKSHGVLASVLTPFWDFINIIRAFRNNVIHCIQVRDKVASGVLCCFVAAFKRLPFVYWMSFPIVEGYESRAMEVGFKKGFFIFLANKIRAGLARPFFYGVVLRCADHIFVQSDAMRLWLMQKGFDPRYISAVPMGVDIEIFNRQRIVGIEDTRLDGRRVIIYVGVLSKARKSCFLLDLVNQLKELEPGILLVLAGDAASEDERQWIRNEIAIRHLKDHVLLTGWLDQEQIVRYVVRAEVGLSPIPRGQLFDVSSPTKLVEYLALGLPSVANDIPDQQFVIEQSGAGICVPMDLYAFNNAILQLLNDKELHRQCAERGPVFVQLKRSYSMLAQSVSEVYQEVI